MRFERTWFAGMRHLETVSKKKMNFLAKGGGFSLDLLSYRRQSLFRYEDK